MTRSNRTKGAARKMSPVEDEILPGELESNERYTSSDIIDAVRAFFGGEISLDPASCAVAKTVENWVVAVVMPVRQSRGLLLSSRGFLLL